MENKLVFIGGAPGIGKSTVAGLLLKNLENSVWLDGDDVWRMDPFIVNDKTKSMVEKNICYVLNSFVQAGFSYVLFTWVLHLDVIVDTLLGKMDTSEYVFKHFTLVCDENTLKQRLSSDVGRTTDDSLAMDRLIQTKAVRGEKIDTIDKTPLEIADILKDKITS